METYDLKKCCFLLSKPRLFLIWLWIQGWQGPNLRKWTLLHGAARPLPEQLDDGFWSQGRYPQKSSQCKNTMGKYIDMAIPKDQYACARICVEVDLEAGLPKAIKLTIGNWCHYKKLDYEQLPFKCRGCHKYGHFFRKCPQKQEIQQDKEEG